MGTLKIKKTITSAQLLALNATPIEVIAKPLAAGNKKVAIKLKKSIVSSSNKNNSI